MSYTYISTHISVYLMLVPFTFFWWKSSPFLGYSRYKKRCSHSHTIHIPYISFVLVGGFNPPEKYYSVGMIIPSKPPTSMVQ